jgi:peroxiredoxin
LKGRLQRRVFFQGINQLSEKSSDEFTRIFMNLCLKRHTTAGDFHSCEFVADLSGFYPCGFMPVNPEHPVNPVGFFSGFITQHLTGNAPHLFNFDFVHPVLSGAISSALNDGFQSRRKLLLFARHAQRLHLNLHLRRGELKFRFSFIRSLMMRRTIHTAFLLTILSLLCSAPGFAAPAIGQAAPDFSLKDLKGNSQSLEAHRGKIVVITFLSTQCPIANAYHERIRALAADYAGRNVVLLGIYPNNTEPLSAVKSTVAREKLSFPIMKDEGNIVADLYNAATTPEIFVVDGQGVLRYHGRIDNSAETSRVVRHDLREALNEMLDGKPVSVPQTKQFGCSIKRVKAAAKATAVSTAAPVQAAKVALLKAADFPKLRDSAKGQVLVLNFWATWCGPCVAEFPEFVQLDAKYRDKGVKVIAISADEPGDLESKVRPFLKQQKAIFDTYVQDVENVEDIINQINKDWPGALPATFIFDKQGNIAHSFLGIVDREKLLAVVEENLKK